MSKRQMIEQIRHWNQTASAEFLLRFDEQSLLNYLHRLTTLHGRRGPGSVWVRHSDTTAITTRSCA